MILLEKYIKKDFLIEINWKSGRKEIFSVEEFFAE